MPAAMPKAAVLQFLALLTVSNVFMNLAWYGHLKFKGSPLWLAILASTGQLPTVANLSLDRLTGTGSTFNLDGTRVDAAARSRLRATGLEAPAVRRDAATELRSAVPDP